MGSGPASSARRSPWSDSRADDSEDDESGDHDQSAPQDLETELGEEQRGRACDEANDVPDDGDHDRTNDRHRTEAHEHCGRHDEADRPGRPRAEPRCARGGKPRDRLAQDRGGPVHVEDGDQGFEEGRPGSRVRPASAERRQIRNDPTQPQVPGDRSDEPADQPREIDQATACPRVELNEGRQAPLWSTSTRSTSRITVIAQTAVAATPKRIAHGVEVWRARRLRRPTSLAGLGAFFGISLDVDGASRSSARARGVRQA